MVAKTQNDIWAMESDEAERLGAAIANFEQHFPVNVDPKVLAAAQLAGALAWSYGPRVAMTVKAAKSKREASKKKPENVETFPGNWTHGDAA